MRDKHNTEQAVTRRAFIGHVCIQPLFLTSMAPSRRPRSPNNDDTESDFEQETPRGNKLKKRLSEIHRPGANDDGSFTMGSEGRVPLRSVNINDDAAEKRRRRKSTKINVIESALAVPIEGGATTDDQQIAGNSKASGKQKQQLNAVAPPVINVQLDISNAKFEEWMKMATDNVSLQFCFRVANNLNISSLEN